MPRYRNDSAFERYWRDITDPRTGATLSLLPGEEVDLPEEVQVRAEWLVLVPEEQDGEGEKEEEKEEEKEKAFGPKTKVKLTKEVIAD